MPRDFSKPPSRAREKSAAAHEVVEAAYKWWVGKRPPGWSREAHCLQPTIGVKSPAEVNIALACGRYGRTVD